jgi:hypothetical protein
VSVKRRLVLIAITALVAAQVAVWSGFRDLRLRSLEIEWRTAAERPSDPGSTGTEWSSEMIGVEAVDGGVEVTVRLKGEPCEETRLCGETVVLARVTVTYDGGDRDR